MNKFYHDIYWFCFWPQQTIRNRIQREEMSERVCVCVCEWMLVYAMIYSFFWIGGLKAECEPLPIIDGFWLLISNGNRRGIVDNGKRKELGTNNGERKNCNQSVELNETRERGLDDGNGGGNGK